MTWSTCILSVLLLGCGASSAAPSSPSQPDAGSGAPADSGAPQSGLAHVFVYGAVPGLAPSVQYAVRIRPAGATVWQDAFALSTTAKVASNQDAYWSQLNGWTDTYVNFETDGPTEIEVSKVSGAPIVSAAAHPGAKAMAVNVVGGKAYVTMAGPSQIALDIDGQMDNQDTGLGPKGVYAGPPIHALTLFANPILSPRPDPSAPGVYAVQPGETPPTTGDWQTLYFLPGVHDIGLAYPVHAGKTYYIPGDAVVYGTFNNTSWTDGHDIHITGYGTVSGEHLTHPAYVTPPPADFNTYCSVAFNGALNSSIVGPTIIDPAYHAVIVVAGFNADKPTTFSWVKILGWRKNGDGINPFANGLITDSFFRTQDDSTYVNGRGIQRAVYWNDANGSALVLSALPNTPVTVEDVDVIYSRAVWNKWSGGRIFNMRGEGGGAAGAGVVFRNIRLEDPRPTLQAFFLAMADIAPYFTGKARTAGALAGVTFQDITLSAPSVLGEPDILWGSQIAPIENLTFDHVTIGGAPVTDASHFKTNAFVSGLVFPQ